MNQTPSPKIIAVISTKGGVGKTTTTANIGGFLADQGFRTLLVDADVQPSLSNHYVVDEIAEGGLQALMTNPHVRAEDVTSRIEENLDIVLSDDPHSELQKWVRDTADGRFRLKRILKERFSEYDFILVDTQGAVGPLQEATVIASDLMLSPVEPDKLAASEFLHNTTAMINRLSESVGFMGMDIGTLHVFLNKVNDTVVCKEYSSEIRNTDYTRICRVPVQVLNSTVPSTVVYKDAAASQMPVHRYETNSRRKTGSAFDTMAQLCRELLSIDIKEPGHE
jgi:chromosome partitioning related protein ParA